QVDSQLCHTTSWVVTTRMVGGLIMAHGDDRGIVVPPALAPTQVVVLLVRDEDGAGEAAEAITRQLHGVGVRARLDAQVVTCFRQRANVWELKVMPERIDVGTSDMKEGTVTLERRDTGEKVAVPEAEAARRAEGLLPAIQADLLAAATRHRQARTAVVAYL